MYKILTLIHLNYKINKIKFKMGAIKYNDITIDMYHIVSERGKGKGCLGGVSLISDSSFRKGRGRVGSTCMQ